MKITACVFAVVLLAISSSASARPAWLSRCYQIRVIESVIEGQLELHHTPEKAFHDAMNTYNRFSEWKISKSYAKRLVNLTFFNPQWRQLASDINDPIGDSLFNGCVHAHQNKERGIHPLK